MDRAAIDPWAEPRSALGLMTGASQGATFRCMRQQAISARRPIALDDAVLVAAVLAVVALLQVLVFLPIAPKPIGALVALGSTVPLAWRRTHPVAAAVAGSLVWLVPTDGYVLVGYLAAFFLYYSVGAFVGDRRVAAAVTAFGVAVSLAGTALSTGGIGEYVGAILAVVAPVGVGILVRDHRERASRLEELAVYLEQERDRQAHAAVSEERGRIARELHDIVSHAVSVIAIQADAAEAALERDPDAARRPMRTVRASAGEALSEMRRLLGVLRADDQGAEHAPLPGLGEVSSLVERERAGGRVIELTVEGEPRRLPQSLDLSAYRIVQEALTNARKYAPDAPVSLRLRWLPNRLELDVRDWGPGPLGAPSATAQGLVGMRERVRLHGGELRTGAATGGGFEVHAELPVAAW